LSLLVLGAICPAAFAQTVNPPEQRLAWPSFGPDAERSYVPEPVFPTLSSDPQQTPTPAGEEAVAGDRCPQCGAPLSPGCQDPSTPDGGLRQRLHDWLDPPGRFRGPGQPLLSESWRFRPFSISWFMGGVQGSTLVNDWISQERGYLGGYRIGWDFHDYWGCELRYAMGFVRVSDSQRAIEAQEAADDAIGIPPDDPFRHRFDAPRDSDLTTICDVDFLYYPWGDSAWRPYFLAGLGYVRIDFVDRLSQYWQAGMLGLPVGGGIKYRWNQWLALRLELLDNIAVGAYGINTLHEVSFTAGAEIRFGGTRTSYWPWNPGLHYW
jgi:hypothetical protein